MFPAANSLPADPEGAVMPSSKRQALTDEERAERRRHEQELTERAVAQLRSSTGWQRWLTVGVSCGAWPICWRR